MKFVPDDNRLHGLVMLLVTDDGKIENERRRWEWHVNVELLEERGRLVPEPCHVRVRDGAALLTSGVVQHEMYGERRGECELQRETQRVIRPCEQ